AALALAFEGTVIKKTFCPDRSIVTAGKVCAGGLALRNRYYRCDQNGRARRQGGRNAASRDTQETQLHGRPTPPRTTNGRIAGAAPAGGERAGCVFADGRAGAGKLARGGGCFGR